MKTLWIILLSASLAAQLPASPIDEEPVLHYLQVSRFVNTPLAGNRADQIIKEMQTVLVAKDGPYDVACTVGFVRSGPVTTFTIGTGIINNENDFTDVENLPGNVKAVTRMNWCGSLGVNIIGCARTDGDSMVVVRINELDQEGILWAHEFGHNQGLTHRTGRQPVMNKSISSTTRQINVTECQAYKVP